MNKMNNIQSIYHVTNNIEAIKNDKRIIRRPADDKNYDGCLADR
ncbi:unnamed protein product, partial [Brachionus calyciflorus]